MSKAADRFLAGVRARGSDARDVRDAAHEAYHATRARRIASHRGGSDVTRSTHGAQAVTIRMALRALRAGKLQALYVVGRDGALLEWEGWA